VGGHRISDNEEIESLLSVSDGVTVTEKNVALYARVSTQKQAGNLIYGARGGRKKKGNTNA
jgi:predicted site-specific integrase-resolvase